MDHKKLSLILGLITIICWGSLATFGQILVHMPPFFVLGFCFLMGSIPAFFKFKEMFANWKLVLWGTMGYFGYHFFLFYSFRFAPALEANLINYLWPIIMVLIAPVFFPDSKLKVYHIVGAVLAVLGSVILVTGKGGQFQWENLKGYLLALGAALTWPLYSIGKKKMGSMSVWSVGGACFLSGILCFSTHALIEPVVVLNPRDLITLIMMGIGPFGLAFYFWDLAMKMGDTRLIGALAYLTPVLSTLLLIVFTPQEIHSSTIYAMILIISGASTGLLDFFPSKRLK